ncbi:MAG: hypothetical protein ACE5I1_18170 [bacterium]
MWRILKEELAYNKLLIFLMVAFCIACFVTIWFGVKWQRNRAPLTMLIMLVMTVVVGYSGVKNRIGQKRDRMYILLPLSLRQVGCTHLLYPLSIWLS